MLQPTSVSYHQNDSLSFRTGRELTPSRHTSCSTHPPHSTQTDEDKLHLQLKSLEYELNHSKHSSDSYEVPFSFEDIKEASLIEEGETTRRSVPKLRWCPACAAETTAYVEFCPAKKTLWAALGIFLLGGVLGCFALPYMTDHCKEARVVCGKCHHVLRH